MNYFWGRDNSFSLSLRRSLAFYLVLDEAQLACDYFWINEPSPAQS